MNLSQTLVSMPLLALRGISDDEKLMIGLLSLACVFSAQSADRPVVAGGSLSELIYAMGVGNRVVGVDETTSYPPETAALPHIGYWKQLSSEGILSLHPDSFITAGCRPSNRFGSAPGAES